MLSVNGVPENGRFSWRDALRHDLPASMVVFLVALPLCMGIAIASGMPPIAGIITGIVGGLVVGAVAGAPLQVSGPAAGLSVMVFEIVQREGPGVLAVVGLICGAIQIASGVLRFGQWFRAVSPAVIRGMLTGIGVLIFVGQFHVMVDDAPRSSGLRNIVSLPEAVWKGLTPSDDAAHHWAAVVGLLTIAIILAWKGVGRGRLRAIPAPLLAVAIATAYAAVAGLPVKRVAIPEDLFGAIHLPKLGELSRLLEGQILLAGIAMAFVASAESLLCTTAVDKMHKGPRARYDRELIAQGVGNTICGALGALPMTGVIVRSSANVEAGARSRASAVAHGAWLLLFLVALPHVLRMIPTACLAAILVYTGYKLIDIKAVRELRAFGRGEVAIFLITAGLIVVADLLTGVLIGVSLSAAKLLHAFSRLEIRAEEDMIHNRTTLYLRGAATFIGIPPLAAALERVRPNCELHVHFERLNYIDHACLDLLMNWEKQHESTGGRLVLDWDYLTAKFHRMESESGESIVPEPPAPRPVLAAVPS